jgi:hypothetical protein
VKTFESLKKNNGELSLEQVADLHGIPVNRANLLPGRFYYFEIVPPAFDLNEEFVRAYTRGKRYLDLNPIGLVFFHENWKETAVVLDLRVIPPPVTEKLLNIYWNFSLRNGLTNSFDVEEKIKPLNERQLLDQRFYMITPSLLSELAGADNLYYAINKYNMDDILSAKMIDWDQFGMLVNPRLSERGLLPSPIDLMAVYEDFLTNSLNR